VDTTVIPNGLHIDSWISVALFGPASHSRHSGVPLRDGQPRAAA